MKMLRLNFLLWALALVDRVRTPIVAALNRHYKAEDLRAVLNAQRKAAQDKLEAGLARSKARTAHIENWLRSTDSN